MTKGAAAVLKAGSRPPWVGLGAAVWVQAAAGTSSAFALYSHALKAALGVDQRGLALLGVACDVGDSLGLLPGVVCNRLHPALLLLIAAASSVLGYGVAWLVVSGAGVAPAIPYWVVWLALCIASNSGAWMATAVLVTNMRNFPLSRGAVAGILKGYAGLSAAVYTAVYTGLLRGSSADILLFLSLGVAAVCLLTMYLVKPCEPSLVHSPSEQARFLFVQAGSALLGVYLVAVTVLDHVVPLTAALRRSLIAVMALLLFAPLAIPLKMTLFPASTDRKKPSSATAAAADDEDPAEPFLLPASDAGAAAEDIDELLAEGEGAVKPPPEERRRRPRRGEDFRFREALLKADFWLLFAVFFIGVGSGVTVLNNLAQVGAAAGAADTTISLSLFSFGNFFGRLGGGAVSDYLVRSRALPRTVLLACTQVVMIVTYLLFAAGLRATLYGAVAVLGVCYGTQFSVMVSTSSELFGLKQFGKIYNFIYLGNPLGALLFSSLAGYVYDREAARQRLDLPAAAAGHGGGAAMVCHGPVCFRLTFCVLSAMACVGTLLSAVLTARIRPVYRMLYGGGPPPPTSQPAS